MARNICFPGLLVSSGAVAEGVLRLGWEKRPSRLYEQQAAAAVGQMGLVQAYETHFRSHGIGTAQVLLTHQNLSDREQYLNARMTLVELLNLGIVPVINENDTIATNEIKVGDNDTLGALVTNLIEADCLVILTDQRGLYTADPRSNPDAEFVATATAGDPALESMAGGAASTLSKGGMITKILAAKRAARSGAGTIIASGREENVLVRLAEGEHIGTHLKPAASKLHAPTVNDEAVVSIAQKYAVAVRGENCLASNPASTGGEDFSYFMQRVPGAIALLGTGNEACGAVWPNHSGNFCVDEAQLLKGAMLYAQISMTYAV